MPEDPRGNFTITSITNELDSFKFRVLQGLWLLISVAMLLAIVTRVSHSDIRRKAEAPGPTEQKIAKAHRMAMEAAESAYLAQLAADAKADAAAGYVEPWSMPQSLDQFAGKEGEDDGGLYGEWDEARWNEEQSSLDPEHTNDMSSGSVHTGRDGVIHAEPVSGYEQLPEGPVPDVDDGDDFYGDGGGGQLYNPPPSPPQEPSKQRERERQPLQPPKQRGFAGEPREGAAAPAADKGGRADAPTPVSSLGSMYAVPAGKYIRMPILCVARAGENRRSCCQWKAAATCLRWFSKLAGAAPCARYFPKSRA
jgi:hypothetical protein